MRWPMAFTVLMAATPLSAQSITIDSTIYRERLDDGTLRIERATHLLPGDRVVTILRWDVSSGGRYTVVSPVPTGLLLQSASDPTLEISIDRGRTWQRLDEADKVPHGATHLRWQIGRGGRLSYRAVVR